MKFPKIITIGSATFDIFIKPNDQAMLTLTRPSIQEQWLCLKHGGKIKIDDVIETFGGGATNTAVAFSRMGFATSFVGKIGAEYGEQVVENLKKEKVDTRFVTRTSRDKTGFSTIINTLDGDRTVLGYAGANQLFSAKDLPPDALASADWIFLNHVSGDNQVILNALVKLLDKHPRIHVAWNPGFEQLTAGVKQWNKLLKHIDLLFLNKEEATLFTGIPYSLAKNKHPDPKQHVHDRRSFLPPYADDVRAIMREFLKYGVKNVIITDGRNGAQATDGKHLYFSPVVTTNRVDSLGAGDAFASGFTAAVIDGKGLKMALIYGTLNANSVVSHYGAQKGLLLRKELEAQMEKTKLSVSFTLL